MVAEPVEVLSKDVLVFLTSRWLNKRLHSLVKETETATKLVHLRIRKLVLTI